MSTNSTARAAKPTPRPNRAPVTAQPDLAPEAPDAVGTTDQPLASLAEVAALIRTDATADDIERVIAFYKDQANEPMRSVLRSNVKSVTDALVTLADPRAFGWLIAARDHMQPPPPVTSARRDKGPDRERVVGSVRARVASLLRAADLIANGSHRPVGIPAEITWSREEVWPDALEVIGATPDEAASLAGRPVTSVSMAEVFARAFEGTEPDQPLTPSQIMARAGHPYSGPIAAAMERPVWMAQHGYRLVTGPDGKGRAAVRVR